MTDQFAMFAVIGAGVFLALILVLLAVKWVQTRRAQSWPQTQGRVVVSRVESRTIQGVRDIPRTGNFARIEYTYKVDGREYRGKTVGLGEQMPDVDVEETLDRYPEGREITVYYNPEDPGVSLLERSVPEGVGKGVLVLVLFFGGLGLGGYLYFTRGVEWLAGRLPEGANPMVTAILLFMGLWAVLVALGMHRRGRETAHWLTVPGEIVESKVVSFMKLRGRGQGVTRKHYAPHVAYRYAVANREYQGSRAHMGGEISYSAEDMARKQLERYRVGSPVIVRYNPKNPSESTLETKTRGVWLLWLVALALLIGAWLAAQPHGG